MDLGEKLLLLKLMKTKNQLVHRINGKFTDEHYANSSTGYKVWKEIYEYFGDFQDIHFVAIDLSSEVLNGGYSCGEANVNLYASNGEWLSGEIET